MIDKILTYWTDRRWLVIAAVAGLILTIILFGDIIPLFIESVRLSRQISTQQGRIDQVDDWEVTVFWCHANRIPIFHGLYIFYQMQRRYKTSKSHPLNPGR